MRCAQAASPFPDTRDRIELRTVGRQEIQLHPTMTCLKPGTEIPRMVIRGVVQDQLQTSTGAVMLQELLQKPSKTDPIECLFHPRHQFAISNTHSPEQAHVLAGRSMQEDGVGFFRRNPHGAAGTMLLKVTFVQTPEIDVIAAGESAEFFYMPPAAQDRHAPGAAVVFGVGTPAHGKAAGIGGRRCALDRSCPNDS